MVSLLLQFSKKYLHFRYLLLILKTVSSLFRNSECNFYLNLTNEKSQHFNIQGG